MCVCVCMYVYIYVCVCVYIYIFAKWAAVFINYSFYQFAFRTQYLVKIILPLLFPPFSAILFPWGNRQNDIHKLFAFLTRFLSSGLSSQNSQSEMNDLCPCQRQVISLWKRAPSRVLWIRPCGDGTHSGVLSVNGRLKVVQQGTHSTACLRRGQVPPGSRSDIQTYSGWLANEVKNRSIHTAILEPVW